MGIISNLRGSRAGHNYSQQEELPISENGSSSNSSLPRKKWSNLMPLFVALVVILEISFLGRLDMVKNAAMFDSLADFLHKQPPQTEIEAIVDGDSVGRKIEGRVLDSESCEEWLERVDAVNYSRDFEKDPILVTGAEQEWRVCDVRCKFGYDDDRKPDASFGMSQQPGTDTVLRSMESSQYYAENNIAQARRRGYTIVMTTSLSSDVPVGYFSWAEYDIMAPVQPKTESALAAAFISNCGARNFRLQALEALEKENVKIDSYGGCHRNRDGRVEKVETLKRYKFSLAFENSNEEDYVTEKFFQALVAGSVPVVVGAPNIQDFAPSPKSILHIREREDVKSVAKTMKYLAENPEAYNQSLSWKYEGPSDSFKALVDMAAVHSSCRLCIYLATKIQEREETNPAFRKRPCKCTRGSETVHHLSGSLTLKALESAVLAKFKSLKHVPIWKQERPKSIRGEDELKIYRIHPVGLTQRQALYEFKFNGDDDLKRHIESSPCAKFEVIFV
ncbi:glycoprotein 3-alpha-L-fucosyltransferase A [Citrus sinensis]|uniref:Glycoprotein 3-alpha-L-fucosyltransferase A n=1 Tax=Citrus sinensis TaxID=2711 RepID=A0ACB8IEV8_CITSI|nr:glycoprotein 3-alpha-L-fucosyltransferase A [Citrus sinensis]